MPLEDIIELGGIYPYAGIFDFNDSSSGGHCQADPNLATGWREFFVR